MAPRLACGSVFAWGVESFRCHGANPWRVRPSKLRTTVGVSRLAGDASFWPAHCWAAIRRFDGTPDCIRGVAGLSPCHGLPLHAGRACADQHQCRCRFSRHRAAPTTPRRGCQPLGLIRRSRCVKELSGSARSLDPSLLRRTSPAPPPASAWFAPVSLGLGGLAALGSIKHDVCWRVNTMFKQICNFARPGAARAQKKPPGCFYTRRLVAVDNDSTWSLKWLHHAYRLQFDR